MLVNIEGQKDTIIVNNGYRPPENMNILTRQMQIPAYKDSSDSPLGQNKRIHSVDSEIELQVETTPETCGISNGSMIISARGGTSPYTFSYTKGTYTVVQNTGNFINVAAGTYGVTVKDSDGAVASATVVVNALYDGPVAPWPAYTNPSSSTAKDGSLTYSVSGGLPPYALTLDMVHYQNSPTFTDLPAGFYFAMVTDSRGCSKATPGLWIGLKAHFGKGIEYSQMTCGNSAIIEVSIISGGTPPFEYSLDGEHYQSSGRFENNPPGIYDVHFRDSEGLLDIYRLIIFPLCNNISYSTQPASCGKADGSLKIETPAGDATYEFTIDGINYQSSPEFNGLRAGNYAFTVRDNSGKTESMIFAIEDGCPIVRAITTAENCGAENGTITAIAIQGEDPQFSLDGVNYQTAPVFENLAAGNYTLTIKDKFNNTSSVGVEVKGDCMQISSVSTVDEKCDQANGSVTAEVSGGTAPLSYSLDNLNFQNSNIFQGLSAGTYTLYVKDLTGESITSAFEIQNLAGPDISLKTTKANCQGTGGVIEISSTGGLAPFTYSVDALHFADVPVFDGLDTGKYFPAIKDANNCIVTTEVAIEAVPVPDIYLGNDTAVCNGQPLLLSLPNHSNWVIEWNDHSAEPDLEVTKGGIYFVKVTNEYGCMASDTIQISDRSVPVFSIGKDTAVCGPVNELELKPYPAVEGDYLWNTGQTTKSLLATAPGMYQLVVDNLGCKGSAQVNIVSKPVPELHLGKDTSLCTGEHLYLSVYTDGATYQWQDGTSGPGYDISVPGKYSVTVSLDGCTAAGTINVSYIPKPVFSRGGDTSICEGEKLILSPRVNTAVKYLWQNGSSSPSLEITGPGTYTLRVENSCGYFSDKITIKPGDCNLYLPNAFTPNNDAVNDVFRVIKPYAVVSFRLSVYNRYGQKVFETDDMKRGWDGRFGGEPQPAGAYVWKITIEEKDKPPYALHGIVMLLR